MATCERRVELSNDLRRQAPLGRATERNVRPGHKLERHQATSALSKLDGAVRRAVAPASTPGLLLNVMLPWLTTLDTNDFRAMPESLPT